MGYTLGGVCGVQARHIHQIGNHGRGRLLGPCASAVVHSDAGRVTLHHDAVHRTFDIGQEALGRNQRGVDAQLNALAGALGNTEQLDPVTHLEGVGYVGCRELGDAFHMVGLELDWNTKSHRGQDGGLVRGIKTFDIKTRIGFGVTQGLRLRQHGFKAQAFIAHLAQNEIRSAVDDASHPLNAVAGESLAQSLDDGNAHRHRAFKRHHDAVLLRGRKHLIAVFGEQGFVGRHHVLAVGDRAHDQLFGQRCAADDLDHNFHVGVVDHLKRIGCQPGVRTDQAARANQVACGNDANLNAPSGPAFDFFLVALQHAEGTATDGADSQKTDLDGFQRKLIRHG